MGLVSVPRWAPDGCYRAAPRASHGGAEVDRVAVMTTEMRDARAGADKRADRARAGRVAPSGQPPTAERFRISGRDSADLNTRDLVALDAVIAAERLLTARLGAEVRLADPEDLGGSGHSTVLRVRVAHNPFSLPRTLVLKHCTTDLPDDGVDQFAQEAASCQLFTAMRAGERPGPELIASDAEQRLLVLEDLGRSGTVAEALNSTDAVRAEQALLAWARALGQMHASTWGREQDFAALQRRLGQPTVPDPLPEHTKASIRGLPAVLHATLGVETPDSAVDEALRVARQLGGGRYRAFSPSDLGPDNAVVAGRTVRFIDFEGGGFRTVFMDVAQLRAPLPSSIVTHSVGEQMAQAMTAAWHGEVVGMWPELEDESLLANRLLDGDLGWTWLCTWWLLAPEPVPTPPIDPDAVQSVDRLLTDRWESLADLAAELGRTEFAEYAASVAAALRHTAGIHGPAMPRYPVLASAQE